MQRTHQTEELLEMKTELKTVVEALSILQDFIDSVFGPKFQSFCGQNRAGANDNVGKNAQDELRDLRWKHLNSPRKSGSCSSASLKAGGGSEESRCMPMIGSPEMIDVKNEFCDEDVPDFLDDVDPFSGEASGVFHGQGNADFNIGYEGGGQELKVRGYDAPLTDASPPSRTNSTSSQNRFVPGLIPIQSDPLQDAADDDGSFSLSSESEHEEWHTSSKKSTIAPAKRRRTRKIPAATTSTSQLQPKRTPPNTHNVSYHLQRQSSSEVAGSEGGPFKCNQCPSSYKQEESLRSHQKYKHNPSRVQCQCPLCGKSMVDKYRLQRHLRLHTGEKPFSCQYCGQRFYRKDYHTKHMQRKHGLTHSTSSTSTSTKSAPTTSHGAVHNLQQRQQIQSKSAKQSSAKSSFVSESGKSTHSSEATKPCQVKTETMVISHQPENNMEMTRNNTDSSMNTTAAPKHANNFMDYFSSHTSAPSNPNLMGMTSLTFDDLISADL